MPFSASRVLAVVAMTAVALAALAVVGRSAAYEDLSFWTYDFVVNHSRAAPVKEIVLVDFDEETFNFIGQYPVPRRRIAEVLAKVSASRPTVIGLDMFLSESSRDGDREMQSVLTQAGNVVLASQIGAGGIPRTVPLSEFCQPEDSSQLSGFCKEGTPGALAYAPVNLPLDDDGFIRRFFLFSEGDQPAISFPMMLAQQFTGQPIRPAGSNAALFQNRRIAYSSLSEKTVLIGNWQQHFTTLSAHRLLGTDHVVPELAGEIVIIGQSSDAARDRHLTPAFRYATTDKPRPRLSGAEIHAAAIATLLSGNAVVLTSGETVWIFNAAVVFAFLCVFLAAPLRMGITVLLFTVAGVPVGADFLFRAGHIWFPFLSSILTLALALPLGLGYRFFEERILRSRATQEREQIMGMFSRYVSPDVAQQIWERRREVALAGEERVATVIFTDIRSFTAITAGKSSSAVLRWLNEYLTAMNEIITEHHGFLNKFIGDGLMILFGVPLSEGDANDAGKAVSCALAMLGRVAQLNEKQAGDLEFPQLKIGVGIHTGKLTSGNIGSTQRMEYSVIGETVNLASRLESLTKEFHCDIVLSSATYELVKSNHHGFRSLGDVVVRGFEDRVELYALNFAQEKQAATTVNAVEWS